MKQLTICETFVGCGGAHFGFMKNGFKTIFANDIWADALETLKYNNKELLLLEKNNIIC